MSTVIVTQEETGTAVFTCKFMRQRRRVHLRVKLELSPHPALQDGKSGKNEPPGRGRAASRIFSTESTGAPAASAGDADARAYGRAAPDAARGRSRWR